MIVVLSTARNPDRPDPRRRRRGGRAQTQPRADARHNAVDLGRRARPDRRVPGAAAGRPAWHRGAALPRRDGDTDRGDQSAGGAGPGEARQGRERALPAGARAARRAGPARGDGPHADAGDGHAAQGDGQPRLRAEAALDTGLVGRDPAAQRGRDGGHGLPLRLRRAVDSAVARRPAAARHARASARRKARRGRLEGPARRISVGAGGRHRRPSAKGTSPAMPSRRANTSPNSLRRVISDSSTRRPSSS